MVRVDNVRKHFPIERGYLRTKAGVVKAVDGVSLEIAKSETFGLVGESGCGKTTLGKIILGILKPDSGRVEVDTDRMQVIFQDPRNSLDPKMKVSEIISEGLLINNGRAGLNLPYCRGGSRNTCEKVEHILDLVKLPKEALDKYPHQFSGGERQRIAIARAVVTKPEFIVCDEPVSSLDVTVQFEILNLLKNIQKSFGITYLFISHDLRVIKYMSSRMAVMKDGVIVEEGPTEKVYSNPTHPYTKLLIDSILSIP